MNKFENYTHFRFMNRKNLYSQKSSNFMSVELFILFFSDPVI